LESTIIRFSKPHGPHAAVPYCRDQALGAHGLPNQSWGLRRANRTDIQKACMFRRRVTLEQFLDFVCEDRFIRAQQLQSTGPVFA